MTERRPIMPRHLMRAGSTLTIARFDRREIFTELGCFARCYHSPEAVSRFRARTRAGAMRIVLQAEPRQREPDWEFISSWLASQPLPLEPLPVEWLREDWPWHDYPIDEDWDDDGIEAEDEVRSERDGVAAD